MSNNCANNKKARVTALSCLAARPAANADRAYTQPHGQCQILYDKFTKKRAYGKHK
jgi:hypothetical protein